MCLKELNTKEFPEKVNGNLPVWRSGNLSKGELAAFFELQRTQDMHAGDSTDSRSIAILAR